MARRDPGRLRLHLRHGRRDALDGAGCSGARDAVPGALRPDRGAAAHTGAPREGRGARVLLHPGLGRVALRRRGPRHRGGGARDRLPRRPARARERSRSQAGRGHTREEPRGADAARRASAWQLSAKSLELVAKHGFEYSSNMMDRLAPYLHPETGGRALVEIPVSWVLDDAPFFMFTGQRSIQAPGPVLQGWITEFDGITEAHGVTNFTFHPQIIGRPSRLACLRELLDHVKHTPRVWTAPLAEIAAHWRTTRQA